MTKEIKGDVKEFAYGARDAIQKWLTGKGKWSLYAQDKEHARWYRNFIKNHTIKDKK